MRRGHRPQRTCVGCGVRADKDELLRFVRDEKELKLSADGGRGGYLHQGARCWEAFVRRKNLYRTFRAPVEREPREKFVQTLRGQR